MFIKLTRCLMEQRIPVELSIDNIDGFTKSAAGSTLISFKRDFCGKNWIEVEEDFDTIHNMITKAEDK